MPDLAVIEGNYFSDEMIGQDALLPAFRLPTTSSSVRPIGEFFRC